MTNGVIIQFFHWYNSDNTLWDELKEKAQDLVDAGFSAVWIPPCYKENNGGSGVGYGTYDLFDLGEFNQKGSTRTKYGTKPQLLDTIKTLQNKGLQVYADVVFNHKDGGDAIETIWAQEVDWNDRNRAISDWYQIDTWTSFTFPGRGDKYSSMKWHWWCFDALTYNARTHSNDRLYRIQNKTFSTAVSHEHGNYEYLMANDLDMGNEFVRGELLYWGRWFVDTTQVDGFRIDAVKHIRSDFFKDWLNHLRVHFGGRELFSVGEYWSPNIDELHAYISASEGRLSLVDVPLHYKFSEASKSGNSFDLRTIFDRTLVKEQPSLAVTFVENHDTQPLQSLESVVESWFKPLAYAMILLRLDGYPCVFYADYYGAHYQDKGRDKNDHEIWLTDHSFLINKFLWARKAYGFGERHDYFDHPNTIGWIQLGDRNHPGAMAVVLTNGSAGNNDKTPLQDLVVILPGILGSVLQKDGKDLWGVSAGAIWDILLSQGNALSALNVQQDDPDAKHLDDGIKAVRLVEDVTIIPGFIKVDGYTRTTKMITENFANVTQGNIYLDPDDRAANLYHFPYDWRRDNRVAAKILQKLLQKRLKCWREASGNRDAKIILLAHSMGGLVTRYYLEVLGGWTDCKALFTFGTPYRGSLQAIDFLANGYKQAFIDLTQVMRSMTGVYQLLPRYKALKIGNEFYRIAESPVDLPNIDRAKAIDALKFHNSIDDAADLNQNNPLYRSSFVTCPIVGVVQPTKQSAELLNGKITTSETLPDWLNNRPHLGDGDGTVPQVSATPVQMKDLDVLALADYIAESHGSLQNQPNTLLNLLRRIQSAQVASLEDVRGGIEAVAPRGARGLKGIGLALDDLYLTNEPITMRAKVAEGTAFNSLTAEIICVSEERPSVLRDFTAENGTWVMETDNLAAGIYRVKVQTDNPSEDAPNPVHNSFVVTNLNEGM